jgi:hypothetical protein
MIFSVIFIRLKKHPSFVWDENKLYFFRSKGRTLDAFIPALKREG